MARDNPDKFEELRLASINELIENAPAESRRRLRGLQWRIDQERRLSKSPVDSCIRISRMMWDSVTGPGGMLDSFQRLDQALLQFQACASEREAGLAVVRPIGPYNSDSED